MGGSCYGPASKLPLGALGVEVDSLHPASCKWYSSGSCGPESQKMLSGGDRIHDGAQRPTFSPHLSRPPGLLRPNRPCGADGGI